MPSGLGVVKESRHIFIPPIRLVARSASCYHVGMSKATVEKAQRLHHTGRVAEADGRVFRVVGDHAIYLVAQAGDEMTCNCRTVGACSHMAAVLLTIREQREETR